MGIVSNLVLHNQIDQSKSLEPLHYLSVDACFEYAMVPGGIIIESGLLEFFTILILQVLSLVKCWVHKIWEQGLAPILNFVHEHLRLSAALQL